MMTCIRNQAVSGNSASQKDDRWPLSAWDVSKMRSSSACDMISHLVCSFSITAFLVEMHLM